MAMSLVGNITYINQNSLSQATQFANAQARPDFLQDANLNEYERKLKEVQEIKPTPNAHEVDPDGRNKQEFAQDEQGAQDNQQAKNAQGQGDLDSEKLSDSENVKNIDFEHIHTGMLDIRV